MLDEHSQPERLKVALQRNAALIYRHFHPLTKEGY
jgi:hypothetical protein